MLSKEWVEKFREIIRDFPDHFEGYLGLGKCMYEMILQNKANNYDDAIFTLKFASERIPENPLPYEIIGDIYNMKQGYIELALDNWNKALEKTEDESARKKLNEKIKSIK